MSASSIRARVPARVGLVGNPSDGYGGAVLAAIVDTWSATATVTPADCGLRIRHASGGLTVWDSPAELVDGWEASAVPPVHRLVAAALVTLDAHLGGLPGAAVDWSSTIPRSVGLAGSSAIAVATIEAMATCAGSPLGPRVVAALALEAEVDRLGIAAGWQDRVVQAHRCAVLVDAAEMTMVDGRSTPGVHPVPGLDLDVIVGWRSQDAVDSGEYHGALRRAADDRRVAEGMDQLAALARRAATCATSGDRDGLLEAVGASWQVRRASAPLAPGHDALVEAVRAAGVVATSPGSGGSVVAFPTTERETAAVLDTLDTLRAEASVVRLR